MGKPTLEQAMQMARGSWPTAWDVDPADALDVLADRVRKLETALRTIRDECFSGSAYDIAERALNTD